MKPVAIFRHIRHEGPGFLGEFLDARKIPWHLIAVNQGEAIPTTLDQFSGLVFMGGPMSVNDDLPWIPQSLELIRKAVVANVPVLGHCLGGQLMAKALGGVITRNPVKEIGWGAVSAAQTAEASRWLGDQTQFTAFHWHGETFSIPYGAIRILESEHCANQAFVVNERHLALQCHVEMTDAMIREWCAVGEAEIAAADSPAVQPPKQILEQISGNLPNLNEMASRLYARWASGLSPH
jgi:GMP synthase-like glutamine amidotransferase